MHYIIEDDGVSKKIVYCVTDVERFDFFSYEMFRENEIAGTISPLYTERNGMDAIQYDITNLDTLRNHLSFSITMNNLLSIFAQIISIVEEVDNYLLDNSLMVTNIGQIYYDRFYDAVKMIYVPVFDDSDNRACEERLFALFKEIIFSAKFVVGNDDRYITELLNEISDIKDYSLADFKEVVYSLSERIGCNTLDELCRYTSVSENVQQDVIRGNELNESHKCSVDMVEEDEVIYSVGEQSSSEGSISEKNGIRNFIRKLFYKPESDDEKQTFEKDYDAEGSDDSDADEEYYIGEESYNEDEDAAETMVLLKGSMGIYTPYLIRTSNAEQIAISKRVFKVGKDKRYADYVISDNAAISRAHAEFMVKDGKIYLTDEDSLNSTYVNGEKLVSQQEKEVKNGDVILFADEEYVLYC